MFSIALPGLSATLFFSIVRSVTVYCELMSTGLAVGHGPIRLAQKRSGGRSLVTVLTLVPLIEPVPVGGDSS